MMYVYKCIYLNDGSVVSVICVYACNQMHVNGWLKTAGLFQNDMDVLAQHRCCDFCYAINVYIIILCGWLNKPAGK